MYWLSSMYITSFLTFINSILSVDCGLSDLWVRLLKDILIYFILLVFLDIQDINQVVICVLCCVSHLLSWLAGGVLDILYVIMS